MRTKVNVIRGSPTLFYTQASDHSHNRRFIEICRRRISISVDSSEKKVTDAVALKVERAGGARGEYDLKIVDKTTIYKVKLILAILMRKLRKLSRPYKEQLIRDKTLKLDEVESGTFIPFKQTLKIGLPHKHVLDMTAAETFNTNLTLLPKINADNRPKLIYSDGLVMPIATFEDLAVAMSLLHKDSNPGLSPELQQWYGEVFMEVKNDKVIKQKEREKQDKQAEEIEVSITTADLIKKHKELSQSGNSRGGYKEENSKEILQKYLYPLINAGYIEDEKIPGAKAKFYRPVKDLKYSFYSFSDEKNIFPYQLKMKVEKSELFPTKNMLELQISESLKCSSKYSVKEKISLKLVDVNGDEISIKELIDRYFNNPEDYFLYADARKEETRQENKDAIEDIRLGNKEQKHNAVKQEHLEEHISRVENDNKLYFVSENDENNIQVPHQHIEKNVLLHEEEQIEYSKSCPVKQKSSVNEVGLSDPEVDPEYVYENEEQDEAKEQVLSQAD
jgi:hypothetical protein